MESTNENTDLGGDNESVRYGGSLETQSIIKRALNALTRFQNEEENNGGNKEADKTIKEDKWQSIQDLRGTLVELSTIVGNMSRSPSSEFSRLGGGIGDAVTHLRTQSIPHVHSHIQCRVRTMVSGSPHTPVREYWRSQRSKPAVVRLLDKFAFLWGVLSLVASEYILLSFPHYFWLWYSVFMGSMLATRFPSYLKKKWQYFLLDFCYFAQVCNFAQILFFPSNCTMFKVNFAFGVGPLCAAVVLWRNSLVFHDNERVTTAWVHILPSWFVYATRWSESGSSRLSSLSHCGAVFTVWDLTTTLFVYCLWQLAYFLKTEVIDVPLLDKDPSIQTSLRWLALDTQRPIHKLVLKLLRGIGVMGGEEVFNPSHLKTKCVFMASQLVFTAIAILPVPFAYQYRWFSALYVFLIFCVSVYNGGEYYIEVFSRRYYRQFEGEVHKVCDDDADAPTDTRSGKGDTAKEQIDPVPQKSRNKHKNA